MVSFEEVAESEPSCDEFHDAPSDGAETDKFEDAADASEAVSPAVGDGEAVVAKPRQATEKVGIFTRTLHGSTGLDVIFDTRLAGDCRGRKGQAGGQFAFQGEPVRPGD